jgi:hypothetical protein
MSIFMLSSVIYGQTATPPSVGDGSSSNPYEISSLENLYWLATTPSIWGQNKHFKQTINIDASPTQTWDHSVAPVTHKGWIPIGQVGQEFKGYYDGGQHTINGLYILYEDSSSADYRTGFFGLINNSEIKNLGITNVNISSSKAGSGALVGIAKRTAVKDCYATGTIGSQVSALRAGGLIGVVYANGTIERCYTHVNVGSLSGNPANHGGLVGYLNPSEDQQIDIFFSYSTGRVYSNKGGGLFGGKNDARGSVIVCSCSYWDTDTSGQSSDPVGGIGMSTSDMMNPTKYSESWDFYDEIENPSGVWRIDAGKSYSYFEWSPPVTLPVELSVFTVNQFVNDGVTLQWIAETETNFLGYNVYRSEDLSLGNAEKVNYNIIPGYNTSVRNSYKYEDTTVELEKEYFYWLEGIDLDLTNEFHGPISIYVSDMTEGGAEFHLPPVTRLVGAYPNPFNPSTNIFFSLDKGRTVTIDIYNAQGQFIENICSDKFFDKGSNSVTWSGANLASGVYYISLRAGAESMQKKMLLLK